MQRSYVILDVFSDKRLSGNQLAVVLDANGLDDAHMQAIAREFNLPETIFVRTPQNDCHTAKVRIFTPGCELPFAGHPTVGCAIALAMEQDGAKESIIVLEEEVGPIRCGVKLSSNGGFAEFDLPQLPSVSGTAASNEVIAAALSLEPQEIGFENHRPSCFSGGTSFCLVPVRNLSAAEKAQANLSVWDNAFNDHESAWAAFIYCRETVNHDSHFHARMFAPRGGIPEDPATGSAVAAFAGALAMFDRPRDGWQTLRIEQGIEMKRPSLITLEIEMKDGKMVGGRIGGNAVVFARGTFEA